MRQGAAAAVDAALVGLAAFLGFRFALWSVPCRQLSDCVILTPLIVVSVVAAVGIYLVAGWLLWRTSAGRKIFLQ